MIKERNKNLEFTFLIFLLFLFWINIFSVSEYLIVLIGLYIFRNIKKVKIDITFIFLVFFLLIYYLIAFFYNFININLFFFYFVTALIFYIFGKLIISNSKEKERHLYIILITMGLSHFVYAALTYFNSVLVHNINYSTTPYRILYDIWDNNPINGTNFNIYLSFIISLSVLLIYQTKKNFIYFISLLFFFGSIYISFIIGNRTAILQMIATFLIVILFNFKILLKIKNITTFIVIFTSFFTLFAFNFLNIKLKFIESKLVSRFSESTSLSDVRFKAWKDTLIGLLNNPLGGKRTKLDLSYVHNFWLDVAYTSGIIPFVILLLVTTIILINSIISIMNFKNKELKIILASYIISFLITFSLEPIMEGYYKYFLTFLFFSGLISNSQSFPTREVQK